MTNISIQSSHNGYLSNLSPYVSHHHPQITTQPSGHQLHAAHHTTIMPPPQNLDTSFQYAYPNGYSAMHPLNHNAHTENAPLIAGYAPISHQHPTALQTSHQLISSQPAWPLAHHPAATTNQLGHLHTINTIPTHSMQTSPTHHHHQSMHLQTNAPITAVPILQTSSNANFIQQPSQQQPTNLSRPDTPLSNSNVNSINLQSNTSGSTSNSTAQQTNVNLAQLNSNQQIPQQPQQSLTPTAIQSQAWYPHPFSSTPVAHPSTNLIAASTNTAASLQSAHHQAQNPAFSSQAITFGYSTAGYVPTPGTFMPTTHWHQNPYIYGNY